MSIYKEKFTYTWSIQNYSFCDKRNGFGLSSPYFTADNLDESRWSIQLYPRGINKENEGFVSLKIGRHCLEPSKMNENIDFNVEFCCSNEILLSFPKKQMTSPETFMEIEMYFFDRVIIINELEKVVKRNPEDTLSVRISFSLIKSVAEEDTSKKCLDSKTTLGVNQISFMCELQYDNEDSDWSAVETFTILQSQYEIIFITDSDDILIKIRKIGSCDDCIQYHVVKCKITLLESDGKGPFQCDSFLFDCNSKLENDWCFPTFLKHSSLIDGDFLNYTYDKMNSYPEIELKFNFSFSNGLTESETVLNETKPIPSSHKFSDNVAVSPLQLDLRKIFLSEKYADVKFKINKEIFTSHKIILASRSPVFSAMFEQDMDKTQTIEISDMKPKTMKLFLEFLYTGVIEKLNCKTVLELLLAAEKYQVPSLTEECVQFLISDFDTDNIFDVVSVADKVGHEVLKVSAFKYIKKNTAQILGSPNWVTWFKKNVEIGSEVLCYLSEKLKTAHFPYI